MSASACLSLPAPAALAPDMGIQAAADQSLPPAYWPEESGVEFLDQAGRVIVFGLPGTLRGALVLEDGSVVAASLDLGRGLFALNGIRFRPEPGAEAGSGRVWLEWRGAPGFLLSIASWELVEKKLIASGALGLPAMPTEDEAGRAASLSAPVEAVQLLRSGPVWKTAAMPRLSLAYRSSGAVESFEATAPAMAGDQRRPSLLCDLVPAAYPDLAFKAASISPNGSVVLPSPAEGTLSAELDDGSTLALTGMAPIDEGRWSARGEAALPPAVGGATLFFREGSLILDSLGPIIGSGRGASPSLAIRQDEWRIELSDPLVSFTGEGISLEADSSSVDYGGVTLPVGRLMRPASGALSTEGARFSQTLLALAGGGFRAASASFDGYRLYLSGSLSFPPGFPASDVTVDGLAADRDMSAVRMGNLPPLSFRAFGSPWTASGLSMTASSLTLTGAEASLPGGRRMKLDSFNLDVSDPEAAWGSVRKGRIENFAIRSDLDMRDASWDPLAGFTASGSAMIEFVVSSQVFRRALEIKKLSLDTSGALSIIDQYWPESPVHAFLGLVFLDADFDFRDGKPSILLSNGSFEKGGAFPSGGRVDGLVMDIAKRAYDKGKLAFSEAATFSWRGAAFTLEGFDSLLDDDYSFYGSVVLPAAPSAPWRAGERLPLSSLRLNGYGQVVSAVAARMGRSLDLRDLLPESIR